MGEWMETLRRKEQTMGNFKIVEKKNHMAVHGVFGSRDSAEYHLKNVVPEYVKRGYYMDKTLTKDSFEVIKSDDRRSRP